MSLAKAVPEGIKDKERKRGLPYKNVLLYKDSIQETVFALKSDQS
jgi:hypothetical protein